MGNRSSQTYAQTLICNAVGDGDLDRLQKQIGLKRPEIRARMLNEGFTDGFTPLMLASKKGLAEVCRALVAYGADVNVLDEHGRSALYYAAMTDQPQVCEYLTKEARAKMDCMFRRKDPITLQVVVVEKESPLHRASARGNHKCCKVLIKEGADVNLAIHDAAMLFGHTPLMLAAAEGHVTVVRLLVNAGALLDAFEEDGNTALHFAAYKGSVDCVRLLVEEGASLEALNSKKEQPKDICRRGNAKNVEEYFHSLNPTTMATIKRNLKKRAEEREKAQREEGIKKHDEKLQKQQQLLLQRPEDSPAPAPTPAPASAAAPDDAAIATVASTVLSSMGAANKMMRKISFNAGLFSSSQKSENDGAKAADGEDVSGDGAAAAAATADSNENVSTGTTASGSFSLTRSIRKSLRVAIGNDDASEGTGGTPSTNAGTSQRRAATDGESRVTSAVKMLLDAAKLTSSSAAPSPAAPGVLAPAPAAAAAAAASLAEVDSSGDSEGAPPFTPTYRKGSTRQLSIDF